MTITIRAVTSADIDAITQIYSHYVLNSTVSFEETPPDYDEIKARIDKTKAADLPYLVAEDDSGAIVGYAYASPYRCRRAYRYTVEESVYVCPNAHGCGIGGMLIEHLVEACAAQGYQQMLAIVTGKPDTESYRFHLSKDFEVVGTLKNVGFKHDEWLDTILMQRKLA